MRTISASIVDKRKVKAISLFLALIFGCVATKVIAQKNAVNLSFELSMPHAKDNLFHIEFNCSGIQQKETVFKLPMWTTGYYQIMNFPDYVQNFEAKTISGKQLHWEKKTKNSWAITSDNEKTVLLSYDVKGTRPFVASNYIDEEHAYISPAGVFIYPDGFLKHRVKVKIDPYKDWSTVATGLDSLKGMQHTFFATDYDVLYDSPILAGDLESFPSFTVKGIPHYFIAYKPGNFDRQQFMNDLKKIVTAGSGIIGDIPYNHYSFLAIGPGGGGIEHLNSTSVAFSGDGLNTKEGRIRMYNFLAHEYFHHYNVKRIRPIELGPFDYDNGSKTKMLWLSEGITVYYEYIILKRAGLTNDEDVLTGFQNSIKEYEDKPGRQFQTSAEASYSTWDQGPFGRTGDDVNKTISEYDKGPALGILLDFKIRHETKNKKSLDDLMRLLYNKYYKQLNRGFTEDEFRNECEKIAGTSLSDFFDYIYTLKTVDYPTYFNYAGLSIDTTTHTLPGGWLGINVKDKNDSLFIASTEWQSPAWDAGLRNRNVIISVNGNKVDAKAFKSLIESSKEGDVIKIVTVTKGG
ncbi:MAG: hypothetical protein QM764_13585 [Chitinophagaceae bacterium]